VGSQPATVVAEVACLNDRRVGNFGAPE
jgi:hypothetical protein